MADSSKQPLGSDSSEEPNVAVLVIDQHAGRWAPALDDWNAATLLACLSEDPADWSELAAVWPRYQAGPSAEFADALPLRICDLQSALRELGAERPWLVLDLAQRRVFSSAAYDEVRRSGCFGTSSDDGVGPAIRMTMELPPWWEIHNHASAVAVTLPRTSGIGRPNPRRDVLWGASLAAALARQMLAVYDGSEWRQTKAAHTPAARYRFTVGVHRDWLMTPREDLGGHIPRESLHGAREWIERVIAGQQWRVTNEDEPIPLPRTLSNYETAPMGLVEVCMYFDACREMIEGGWQWLVEHDAQIDRANLPATTERLAGELERLQHAWLGSPFEEGNPPAVSIQNERDRVPEVAEAGHMIDCDCPICQLMADGDFGPSFLMFDGHHLELDDEFAFSLCETRQQWQQEYGDYVRMSKSIEADTEGAEQAMAPGHPGDELASPWTSSFVADEGLPGDPLGHLVLSFRLAEIIGELKTQGGAQADVDRLNQSFRAYREAEGDERHHATGRLKTVLEQTAERHANLVGRTADLQSRLDELLRQPLPADIDDDVPF